MLCEKKRAEADEIAERILPVLFIKMFGDPATNPKGWDLVTLEQISDGNIRNGLSPSNKGTYNGEVLTLSAITQGEFDSSARKFAKFVVEPPDDKMPRQSDLLVCRGNGNLNLVGCAKFPDQDYDGVLFPDTMIGVSIDFSVIKKNYLETLWSSDSTRAQIEQRARTTNGTHKINQKALSSIEIMLPDLALQEKFESAATQIKKNYVSKRAKPLKIRNSIPNPAPPSFLRRTHRRMAQGPHARTLTRNGASSQGSGNRT